MQLQIARRLLTVVSRWSWVASGGAVSLGNATVVCKTPYNGGVTVGMGCEWWHSVIGECDCSLLDTF